MLYTSIKYHILRLVCHMFTAYDAVFLYSAITSRKLPLREAFFKNIVHGCFDYFSYVNTYTISQRQQFYNTKPCVFSYFEVPVQIPVNFVQKETYFVNILHPLTDMVVLILAYQFHVLQIYPVPEISLRSDFPSS